MGFDASEANIDSVRRREIALIESRSLSDEHEKFLKDVCNKALSRFANVKAVAGSECNTVIELKREHHAASPRLLASLRPSPRSGI